MTGDHDLFGVPAEPVPCQRAGCWCETYDRATHGPLIDFGDQTCAACGLEHPGALCDVASRIYTQGGTMKLLDLFCGAGGCSVGYHRAGFDVVGVDIAPMGHYPFSNVIQDDALAVLRDLDFIAEFDAIHASPPCQHYTSLRTLSDREHPDLVGEVRELLRATGKPYVIENVVGAPLVDPIILCGSMFGLGHGQAILKRHRLFESNVPLSAPPDACKGLPVVGVYGTGGGWKRTAPGGGGVKVSGPDAAVALGIDWTDYQPVLAQAIPPAYTEHIGRQLIARIGRAAA